MVGAFVCCNGLLAASWVRLERFVFERHRDNLKFIIDNVPGFLGAQFRHRNPLVLEKLAQSPHARNVFDRRVSKP